MSLNALQGFVRIVELDSFSEAADALFLSQSALSQQIRALDDPALAGITILAMTANAFDEDRKKALKCGMDGFLSKPIVIEELISALQDNLYE